MMNLKNFKLYTPDDPERAYLVEMGMAFYIDDAGNDWHNIQSKYQPDTLKIAYYPDGRVDSFSYDVTAITPRDLSVGEIASDKIPAGFFEGGKWVFDGKVISAYQPSHEELIVSAEATKSKLMDAANRAIAPLQDAVDLDMATDDEIVQLTAWKQYRVLLNRVDTSTAPDLNWPPVPTFIL